MDRYKMIKEVGDGTFGSVWRAINRQSGELVAIKKMKKKYYSWEECVTLREVKSLKKMNHPNIVKLKEVIRENDILYFVFEYMEYNLYQLIRDSKKLFTEIEVRNWCFQVFQGLAYMHQRGYFHRDLKPENLLVSKHVIKLADFGLAREINSQPPYTQYVSTRWYRAPEVLLQAYLYGPKVDMWAMGAIIAELFTLRPLFPGTSEADEIYKICGVLGSPTEESWPEGLRLANDINYIFPQLPGASLRSLIRTASEDAINLISVLCSWDPCKRPSAVEALQHPFFKSCYYIPPSLRPRTVVTKTLPSEKRALSELHSTRKINAPYSSNLSGHHFTSPRTTGPLTAGVQRKPDHTSQEFNRNEKILKSTGKQSRYQPPGSRSPGRTLRLPVSDTTDKFASMCITSRKLSLSNQRPPMKAGVQWAADSGDMMLRPAQPFQDSRPYARNAVR